MRNHGIVFRVRILCDIEVLLNGSLGVGEKGPLGAERSTEFLKRVVIIGGDRGYLRVCHCDLRIERGKIQMLREFSARLREA